MDDDDGDTSKYLCLPTAKRHPPEVCILNTKRERETQTEENERATTTTQTHTPWKGKRGGQSRSGQIPRRFSTSTQYHTDWRYVRSVVWKPHRDFHALSGESGQAKRGKRPRVDLCFPAQLGKIGSGRKIGRKKITRKTVGILPTMWVKSVGEHCPSRLDVFLRRSWNW